ncbi:MAG: type II secretion system F family protein [Lachnospiraceae bacterium]|nr:type II secretion system F family protein [Lachnospiraceae bacterium]
MSEELVLSILHTIPVMAAGILFVLLLLVSREYPERVILGAYAELRGLLKEKSENSRWYKRKSDWLLQNGAAYHFGKWIQPTSYLTLRLVLAIMGFTGLCIFSVWYGLLAAVVLFQLPELLLVYLNKQDNLKLLPEIKLVYHALELQIRAGVYVTDALAECYGSVQEVRLKQALLDLAGDIVMKADIYDALERFQTKFDNRYIDSLCITILQALESGQAVELLSDIAEQIKDMESAVMERRKASLDRSITFYQLGVLGAVMGIVLYACVTHMYAAAVTF